MTAAAMPEETHAEDRGRLRAMADRLCRQAFAFLEDLTVSECADRHRILPKTSAEPGRFQTDRIPYLRAIQDSLSDPDIPEVVFAKSAQVAGTTVGENFALYVMAQDPSGLLIVWPTVQKYQAWVGERLDPMIDDCDILRVKYRRSTRRDEPGGGRRESGDSMARKVFPGGFLQCLSSKSISQLKSIAAARAMLEELDEIAATAQGTVPDLIRVRQRTFGKNRKLYMNSTPTVAGRSPVWAELQRSTWGEHWVPCPHCGEYQVLQWRDGDGDDYAAGRLYFVWEKDADGFPIPGTTRYICKHCACEVEERHKEAMLAAGEWRHRYPGRTLTGFHISSLYSPLCTWDELVEKFVSAVRGGPLAMMAWVNTWLGLPYADNSAQVDPRYLSDRRESYNGVDAPAGVGLVVAGADVHPDRVEVFVWGYGEGEEAWCMAWEIIEGDPQKPETWRNVAKVLDRDWTHESGATVRIAAMAVDAGYATEHVHKFCDAHARAFAVVGRSGPGKPYLKVPDQARPTKWRKRKKDREVKRPTHVVGSDTLKNELLRTRLHIKEAGPQFIHFPEGLDPVFFDQLDSERPHVVYQDRRPFLTWKKIEGRANEAIDGWVYARAALRKLELSNPKLLKQLGEMARALKPPPSTAAAAAAVPGPRRPARRQFTKGV